ncbi:MAG: OsmC family protein [Desulfobacterales bacterium]
MDAYELRALQAPFKQRYKQDPQRAMIPARAEAVIEDGGGITCRVRTFGGVATAGLHPAAGGDGSTACSADMLMEALVACAGVTFKAVATAMRIPLKNARVIAEGTWNVSGTLAVDRHAPIGLTKVRLMFEINSSADAKKLEKLVQLTERYCVIYQTLVNPPKLSSQYQKIDAA